MRKFHLLLVAFLLVFLFGCEDREPLSWESEIFLPIVDDRIGWLDYVEDSMIVDIEGLEIVDGNPAKIVLHQPIDMISGALAPVLPDTSIEENIGMATFLFLFRFRLITLLSFKKMNFPSPTLVVQLEPI